MKILFVENFSLDIDNPMSTLYPQRCAMIKEHPAFDIYDINGDYDDKKRYNTVIFGARSIYLYKCYKGNMKQTLKNKFDKLMTIKDKYFLIQDMHRKTYGDIKMLCDLLNNNKINIIFTFYNNAEATHIRKLTPNCEHFHLPLHINTQIFNNQNMEKKYDILLYGSIHPTHYPFRKRLFDLVNNSDRYNVCYIEKPENFDSSKCEYGLAKLINQSKMTIATRSKYDYFVAKYLEITLCNSLVVGNMATDGKKLFENNYIKLEETMTNEQILNVLDDVLDNYDSHREKINNMYNKTIIYNLDRYVKELIDIVNHKYLKK